MGSGISGPTEEGHSQHHLEEGKTSSSNHHHHIQRQQSLSPIMAPPTLMRSELPIAVAPQGGCDTISRNSDGVLSHPGDGDHHHHPVLTTPSNQPLLSLPSPAVRRDDLPPQQQHHHHPTQSSAFCSGDIHCSLDDFPIVEEGESNHRPQSSSSLPFPLSASPLYSSKRNGVPTLVAIAHRTGGSLLSSPPAVYYGGDWNPSSSPGGSGEEAATAATMGSNIQGSRGGTISASASINMGGSHLPTPHFMSVICDRTPLPPIRSSGAPPPPAAPAAAMPAGAISRLTSIIGSHRGAHDLPPTSLRYRHKSSSGDSESLILSAHSDDDGEFVIQSMGSVRRPTQSSEVPAMNVGCKEDPSGIADSESSSHIQMFSSDAPNPEAGCGTCSSVVQTTSNGNTPGSSQSTHANALSCSSRNVDFRNSVSTTTATVNVIPSYK